MRKYSIKEIDQMREDLRSYLTGVASHEEGDYSFYFPEYDEPEDDYIELRLRTYLESGVDPEELAALGKKAREERDKISDEADKAYDEWYAKRKAKIAEESKPEFTNISVHKPVFQEIPASENPKVIEQDNEALPVIILLAIIMVVLSYGLLQFVL